jgi:hypothetical protein
MYVASSHQHEHAAWRHHDFTFCVIDVKEQFSIIKSRGWTSAETYSLMSKLWAKEGNVAEMEALVEEAKSDGFFNEEQFLPVLVQVQLNRYVREPGKP